jgi:hypothetical protein
MSGEDELRLKREAIFEAKTKRALVKPVAAEQSRNRPEVTGVSAAILREPATKPKPATKPIVQRNTIATKPIVQRNTKKLPPSGRQSSGKPKGGRPCIGDRPMTSAERSRRRRAERAKEPK